MTDLVFGIYGFDFTTPATISQVEIVPLYRYPDSRRRAEDRTDLLLTGYGALRDGWTGTESDQIALVRRLGDGMTFCQQQLVVPTRIIRISPGDSVEALVESGRLPASLPIFSDRQTFGEAIGNDSFFPGSRVRFLEMFLAHLEVTTPVHPLTTALYRQIEVWRLSAPLVEVAHFLLFSGLEILARAFGPHPDNRNVAVPIAGFLAAHGFAVSQVLAEEWAAARNAMFHRGELAARAPGTGNQVRVGDHLYELGALLADSSLKQIGFDDGHINWNRWQDRQPFV